MRGELAFHGLDKDLGPLEGLSLGETILVHSLEPREADYRLVALSDERGIIALAAFDDATGQLRSVGFQSKPCERLAPTVSDVVGALMKAGPISDYVPRSADPAWWERQVAASRYVWKPCAESFSPYSPFIEVPLAGGNGNKAVVYVGFDLIVSAKLSDPVEGG
jgi:hypothetical protein